MQCLVVIAKCVDICEICPRLTAKELSNFSTLEAVMLSDL